MIFEMQRTRSHAHSEKVIKKVNYYKWGQYEFHELKYGPVVSFLCDHDSGRLCQILTSKEIYCGVQQHSNWFDPQCSFMLSESKDSFLCALMCLESSHNDFTTIMYYLCAYAICLSTCVKSLLSLSCWIFSKLVSVPKNVLRTMCFCRQTGQTDESSLVKQCTAPDLNYTLQNISVWPHPYQSFEFIN